MAYYPVVLYVKGRRCLVVGGGKVAFRKVASLLEEEACVTVISPSFTEDLLKLAEGKAVNFVRRTYQQGDMKGFFIAFAATDD